MSYGNYVKPTQTNSRSVAGDSVKVAIQAAAMSFLLGTGSVAVAAPPSERVNVYSKLPSSTVPEHRDEEQRDASSLVTAEQHLSDIKSIIGLQMSELATFFGVSRQSVHKWQAGTAVPGAEYMGSIRALGNLADGLALAKVSRPADLVRAKAFNGRSLLDLVKNGENYSEELAQLVAESRLIDERYSTTKLPVSDSGRDSDWRSSVSVPYASDV